MARYTNVERALQAHTKRCNYPPPPRRGHTMTDRELVIEFMMLYAAAPKNIMNSVENHIDKSESEESGNANSAE